MDEIRFLFHPEASEEILVAHERYFDVGQKLAENFQIEIERARKTIARSPSTWPKYLFGTQRYLLKGFPFFIVFRVREQRIEIVAVAHERQRPGYWSARASER